MTSLARGVSGVSGVTASVAVAYVLASLKNEQQSSNGWYPLLWFSIQGGNRVANGFNVCLVAVMTLGAVASAIGPTRIRSFAAAAVVVAGSTKAVWIALGANGISWGPQALAGSVVAIALAAGATATLFIRQRTTCGRKRLAPGPR